jgi:hypothetical protein
MAEEMMYVETYSEESAVAGERQSDSQGHKRSLRLFGQRI